MANPRNIISHRGVFRKTEKFIIDGTSIQYDADEEHGCALAGPDDGVAVTVSDNVISTAADAEGVLGKLILVESDGKATVQVGGFMMLPKGTGATFTMGGGIVGDLLTATEGYVRGAASGQAAELLVAFGRVVDDSDTDYVEVLF